MTFRGKTALSGIFFAAFSLRSPMVALGVLLAPVSAALHLSHTVAGVVGALPVLCIGLGAPLARWLSRYLAPTLAINASLVVIAAAGLLRAASGGPTMLLLCTAGIGLGIAVVSTALPALVRAEFPRRSMLATAMYSCGLQFGAVAAAALAVPIAEHLGGWRSSLAIIAAAGAVTTGLWIRSAPAAAAAGVGPTFGERRRIPSAVWVMAGTFGVYCFVYYGLVTWLPSAYQEFGWSAASASQVVTVVNATSLIGAIVMTVFASHSLRPASLPTVLACVFALAAIGFAAAPHAAFLWATMAGLSNGALLPVMLNMPVESSRDTVDAGSHTAVLNGVGYTMAAFAPVVLGIVRDRANSFSASLTVTAVGAVLLVVALAARWTRWKRVKGKVPAHAPSGT
jgi:CP family cyanate transporter-like MFS transporter